jgi:D-xylose transport system substrate-binding protein
MRKSVLGAAVAATVFSLGAAACGSDNSGTSSGGAATTAAATTASGGAATTASGGAATTASGGATTTAAGGAVSGKVGVILPDSKSSVRWETADRTYLGDAFKAAGVQYDIQNAEGDKAKMATIADQMITSGAKVLLIVNLDSASGAAIEKKAADAGVKTIDYDRLTLGGSAAVYVSFDNVKVGQLQGQGLIKCLTDKKVASPKVVELNGSPTDNNATLFKQGYDSQLDPKYASGGWTKVDDQSVPEWDNQKGGQIFEQMLTKANGKIDGVLAANDGLGNAAIAVLKKNNLQVPVTGQDATTQGLQNILAGDQCMTVYKAVKKEADFASAAAIALLKGQTPQSTGTVDDTQTNKKVAAILATPVAIYKDSIKDVIADGYVTAAVVCKGYETQCKDAGIS